MCDFWSAIVTKDGRILTHYSDSHETIKKEMNINDKKPIEIMEFIPLQIVPKIKFGYEKEVNKDNWTITFEREKYDWFDEKLENKVWKQAKKDISERLIYHQEIEELTNKRGMIVKDSKINKVSNCILNMMLGSSQVGQMRDSSQVGEMLGSSQVGEMWDSSQVGEMWGSSTIIKLIKSVFCVVRIWYGKVEKLEKGTVIRFKDNKAEIEHKD